MNAMAIVRYAILVLSTGAMGAGMLIIAGVLFIPNIPEDFRVIMGAVVFLYGLYRFVVAYTRKPEREHDTIP